MELYQYIILYIILFDQCIQIRWQIYKENTNYSGPKRERKYLIILDQIRISSLVFEKIQWKSQPFSVIISKGVLNVLICINQFDIRNILWFTKELDISLLSYDQNVILSDFMLYIYICVYCIYLIGPSVKP